MKPSSFLKHLTYIFAFIVLSCNNEPVDTSVLGDGDNNGNNNPQVTSIILSVSSSSVQVGDVVTFFVIGNNGENLTGLSTISINGNTINGNTYTCNNEGSLTFTATYGALSSNSVDVVVSAVSTTSITLTADVTTITVGEDVTFTVVDENNNDVTASCSFTVNGNALASNVFTGQTSGTFDVVATYNSATSNTVTVTVEEVAAVVKFKKNVLIEDYTGTWCGYCPRVSYGIEQVHAQTDQAVVIAIHDDNPFGGPLTNTLISAFGVTGFPTAMLNRANEWSYPEPNNVAQAVNLTGDDADVGIAMTPTMNGSSLSVDVSVRFGGEFTGSSAKLVVYLLEDDLVYNQSNYTSYYGGANPIVGFVHNDVLIDGFTNALGDTIPGGEVTAGNTYTTTLTMNLPSSVANSNNIKVAAIVVNTDNSAINSREAHFGDTQTFEETN